MKTIVPDYYSEFRCIADRCTHTCCAGWEIDLDRETLEKCKSVPGALGEKLKSAIELCPLSSGGEQDACPDAEPDPDEDPENAAHFILEGPEERCPFLMKSGLCELISSGREDLLCQICRDHPRFRNYWSDRTELGLGMACEEAARIILSGENRTVLIEIDSENRSADDCSASENEPETPDFAEEPDTRENDDWETELLMLRGELFAILQDRSIPTDGRILGMLEHCGIRDPGLSFAPGPVSETACEQLAVYLLYRHFADALYDGKLEERVLFVARSYCRVRNAWAEKGSTEIAALAEIARAFSEEVEYDTDTWGL